MRLFSWKCLPLVFTVLACQDGTAPPSTSGAYVLESVGTRPLPATIHSGEGYATIVLWSTLSFDQAGHAVLVERMRLTSPNAPATEVTHRTDYSYRVTGERITFDYSPPCPPNALCVEPPRGELGTSSVLLFWSGNPPWRPPAFYRLTD
jgi:hypothetical protein